PVHPRCGCPAHTNGMSALRFSPRNSEKMASIRPMGEHYTSASSAPRCVQSSVSATGKLSPADVDGAYAAAQKVVEIHRALVGFLRPGTTLALTDQFVGKSLESIGCTSCFYGY